jgi:hypothetical protein
MLRQNVKAHAEAWACASFIRAGTGPARAPLGVSGQRTAAARGRS